MEVMINRVVLASSSSSNTDESQDEEEEPKGTSGRVPSPPKRKRGMTSQLSAALDRTEMTNMKATFVLTEAATSFGSDVSEYNINRSFIPLRRRVNRAHRAQELKEQF